MITQVCTTKQQNVHIAVEFPMLKPVVEQVDANLLTCRLANLLTCILRQQAGLVAFGGDINRNAGFARDEQRLVAEILCCPIAINQKWKRGTPPAVAAREHVDMQAAGRERSGQGDGEWGLARSASREVADADDGPV